MTFWYFKYTQTHMHHYLYAALPFHSLIPLSSLLFPCPTLAFLSFPLGASLHPPIILSLSLSLSFSLSRREDSETREERREEGREERREEEETREEEKRREEEG